MALPYTPFARVLGFTPLPWAFMAILGGMIVTYLGLVQLGVARFFRPTEGGQPLAPRVEHHRRIRRRATHWSRAELAASVGRAGAPSRLG